MKKCFWRFALVTLLAAALAGCGNKETKEALKNAGALEDQKQYQDANTVLVEALQAREAKIRPATPPADPGEADDLTKKVASDPEILKMERAQIMIYLKMDRADMASAVYKDILSGHPGDSVVLDTIHDPDPLIRTGAVRILGLSGTSDAIPALAAATKDDDKDVRRAAVNALGSIKDPAAVDPLLAALKDSYWFVKSEAAEALGEQHDPRAVNPLLDTVNDSDPSVESSVETALLSLCKAPAVAPDAFVSRLNDPSPKVVMISAVCLAVLKDQRAVAPLLRLATSPDLTTRLEAIKGLGETGDPSAIPVLRQTLKDPNVDMRGWSIIGLGNLKDQDSLPDLRAIQADPTQPPTIHAAVGAAIDHITGQVSAPSGP